MFGALGDVMGLMRQMKQVKEKMEQLKAEAVNRVFEADAGAGAVVARANGAGELLGIKLRPDVVQSSDVEMLEDLIRAAVNAAIRKGSEAMQQEMMQATAGVNLGALGNMLKQS
ncbi:MAG: YbaB/EbfC family nucleoid-associated protein [Phycisphaerae bacterium]|nr:YbaB/EbfC family nucleoid-associated protein [Phycisphaerae bacterium]